MEKSTKFLLNLFLILASSMLFVLLQDHLGPLKDVMTYIVIPIIFTVYIYYALRPLKRLLLKKIPNNTVVTAICFLLFLFLVIGLVTLIGNILITQSYELAVKINVNDIIHKNSKWLSKISNAVRLEEYIQKISLKFQEILMTAPTRIGSILGNVSSIGTQILLTIVGVFYLLKDDGRFAHFCHEKTRGRYEVQWHGLFHNINHILETYISGQMLISIILGALMFIGYTIIRLPNAFLLAVIALITNLIPFLGPILGALPAMLIGFTIGPAMVIKVLIVTVIVQQSESNLVSPNIMGQKLDLHPLIVMIVVLVMMNLFGVFGALIAAPFYMILMSVIRTLLAIYKKRKDEQETHVAR